MIECSAQSELFFWILFSRQGDIMNFDVEWCNYWTREKDNGVDIHETVQVVRVKDRLSNWKSFCNEITYFIDDSWFGDYFVRFSDKRLTHGSTKFIVVLGWFINKTMLQFCQKVEIDAEMSRIFMAYFDLLMFLQ